MPEEERLEEEGIVEEETEPFPEFGEGMRGEEIVKIDTGRGGQVVDVPVGSPFVETLERLANEFNYGGYFRVWLNGQEIVDPANSPDTIEAGMRLAITAYDKVGHFSADLT